MYHHILICFAHINTGVLNDLDSNFKDFSMVTEVGVILLMAEILHHLGCMKPYK